MASPKSVVGAETPALRFRFESTRVIRRSGADYFCLPLAQAVFPAQRRQTKHRRACTQFRKERGHYGPGGLLHVAYAHLKLTRGDR